MRVKVTESLMFFWRAS